MNYTITYSIGDHADEVTVPNRTMNETAARQYAAMDLFDSSAVEPGDIDVNDIEVSW